MRIDHNDYTAGNRAMACVQLLYYHLLREGGITDDQTVFVDSFEFDALQLCAVEVTADLEPEIDGQMIREGAVMHLLCDLNDFILEQDDNFLSSPFVKQVIAAHQEGRLSAIPETDGIFPLLSAGEADFDYLAYKAILAGIYKKYVFDKLARMIGKK